MKKTTIKAVEMVRRIRDAHYEQLRGKSPEERIAFYRAKSREFELQAKLTAQGADSPLDEFQPA
jgi:hypothetical protein